MLAIPIVAVAYSSRGIDKGLMYKFTIFDEGQPLGGSNDGSVEGFNVVMNSERGSITVHYRVTVSPTNVLEVKGISSWVSYRQAGLLTSLKQGPGYLLKEVKEVQVTIGGLDSGGDGESDVVVFVKHGPDIV